MLNLTVVHSLNRFSWMQIAILEKRCCRWCCYCMFKSKKVLIALNVVYLSDSIPQYVHFSGPKMGNEHTFNFAITIEWVFILVWNILSWLCKFNISGCTLSVWNLLFTYVLKNALNEFNVSKSASAAAGLTNRNMIVYWLLNCIMKLDTMTKFKQSLIKKYEWIRYNWFSC